MTDAVILVGGLGKRLGTFTKKIPKPLIKIEKKTFLDILISKIIKFNFKHIYLMCSYKKEKFFKLYHNKKIHNSKIKNFISHKEQFDLMSVCFSAENSAMLNKKVKIKYL